jgi:hypothetical protein
MTKALANYRLNRDAYEIERHNPSHSIESVNITREVTERLATIQDALDLHAVIMVQIEGRDMMRERIRQAEDAWQDLLALYFES